MGDWNPFAPTRIGSDTRLGSSRALVHAAPNQAYLQREKASGTTIARLHRFVAEVGGSKPGEALEALWTPYPKPVTPPRHFPGTTAGLVSTGWETQANSTAAADILAAIDDVSVAAYARNAAARSANSPLDLKARGATAQQLAAGLRVYSVDFFALVNMLAVSGNGGGALWTALLDIGGTVYPHPGYQIRPRLGKWEWLRWSWPLDPSTNLPWTRTGYNQLLDGATDEFGLRVQARMAAEGVLVGGMFLAPSYCVENRLGYYYDAGQPEPEWVELTLSGTAAPTAGSYIWLLWYALNGGTESYLRSGLVKAPGAAIVDDPADTGEHRRSWLVPLTNAGGIASAAGAVSLGAEYAPILIDTGSIDSQSQPYTETVEKIVADVIGGVRLTGSTWISTPDSARLSITGDITVEFLIPLDDHTPAAAVCLIGKWQPTGNQRSWMVEQNTAGNLVWHWSNNGTADNTLTSSVTVGSIGAVDGYAFAYGRVRFDVDNGAAGRTAYFEYSFDRVTWTLLGTAQTSATATSIFDSTAEVIVGAHTGGTAGFATGVAAAWKITADLTGVDVRADVTLIGDPDDTDHPEALAARLTDTTIVDQQGNTWTLQGGATFARVHHGQQVTTAAATAYERILVCAGWADPGQKPDAPLVAEVYATWCAAITGTSPLAVGRLAPEAIAGAAGLVDVEIDLTATWTNTLNTQYVIVFSSAGEHGWRIAPADTHSEKTLTGTTLQAEIEGTSVGGTTDAYVTPGGYPWDRFDLHCALEGASDAPSAGDATVRAAA